MILFLHYISFLSIHWRLNKSQVELKSPFGEEDIKSTFFSQEKGNPFGPNKYSAKFFKTT